MLCRQGIEEGELTPTQRLLSHPLGRNHPKGLLTCQEWKRIRGYRYLRSLTRAYRSESNNVLRQFHTKRVWMAVTLGFHCRGYSS